MADYTWRQWEAEQNDSNLLHASDCERWQAGIELAGGSWDGSWTDLDTSGKGLITIDQFNALESQIQSKVSSYTPKGYDPDSTVQIVPGPDGWNKVEDGILRSVCTPDGVNRNYVLQSRNCSSAIMNNSAEWVIVEDGDFSYLLLDTETSSTWREVDLPLSVEYGKLTGNICLSFEYQADPSNALSQTLGVWSSKTSSTTSTYRLYELSNTVITNSAFVVYGYDGDWIKVYRLFSFDSDSAINTQDGGLQYRVEFKKNSSQTGVSKVRKVKVEFAENPTDWSPAMEDYNYGDGEALSASPQSAEDSDEVAAPEAEEIE